MKNDRIYLQHTLECIGRIEEYAKDGKPAFIESTLIQDAIIRNLQTLGQSVTKISDAVKSANPQVDWRGIIGFRNVLVHDYLGINIERVWEIVEQDIPDLKQKVEVILRSLE